MTSIGNMEFEPSSLLDSSNLRKSGPTLPDNLYLNNPIPHDNQTIQTRTNLIKSGPTWSPNNSYLNNPVPHDNQTNQTIAFLDHHLLQILIFLIIKKFKPNQSLLTDTSNLIYVDYLWNQAWNVFTTKQFKSESLTVSVKSKNLLYFWTVQS